MRSMASIRVISSIKPIPKADKIELATVDGWSCVVQKGLYQEGDTVIYCEPDSWIPHDIAPFLSNGKQPEVFEGVEGAKLRTLRLKGQLSQGLILNTNLLDSIVKISIGDDVSDLLGILKYEEPLSEDLIGVAKGKKPFYIPHSDQDRIQNIFHTPQYTENVKNHKWFVTEKLEGCSMYVYSSDEGSGVCSSSIEFAEGDSMFWQTAEKLNLINKVKEISKTLGHHIVIQGELIGPKIQKNIYKLNDYNFYAFSMYDIKKGHYLCPQHTYDLCVKHNIKHVPVESTNLDLFSASLDDILDLAKDNSKINKHKKREGLIFRSLDGTSSFKVINNDYLLKESNNG